MNDSPPQRRLRIVPRCLRSSSVWVFVLTFVPIATYAMCAVKEPTAWQRTCQPMVLCGSGVPPGGTHVQGWPWGYLVRDGELYSFPTTRLWQNVEDITPRLLIANLTIAAMMAGIVALAWRVHVRRGRWWQVSLREWLAVTGVVILLIGFVYRPLLKQAEHQRIVTQLESLGWKVKRYEAGLPGWFYRPLLDAGVVSPYAFERITGVAWQRNSPATLVPGAGEQQMNSVVTQTVPTLASLSYPIGIRIWDSNLNDEGLLILCSKWRRCHNAQFLGARRLSDASVRTLIKYWPDLEELDLSATGITSQGVAQLASLRQLSRLQIPLVSPPPVEGAIELIRKSSSLKMLTINYKYKQHPDFPTLEQLAEERGIILFVFGDPSIFGNLPSIEEDSETEAQAQSSIPLAE